MYKVAVTYKDGQEETLYGYDLAFEGGAMLISHDKKGWSEATHVVLDSIRKFHRENIDEAEYKNCVLFTWRCNNIACRRGTFKGDSCTCPDCGKEGIFE